MSNPNRWLRRESVMLTLDKMNSKVSRDSSDVVNTLAFDEVVFHDDRRLTALFIRLPSAELLPQPDFFEEARRLLQ